MIYAFVPARSGSTRLPDKNIRPLAGTPLVGWTLRAAMQSRFVDKIIFSSDSEQYISIAQDLVGAAHKELLIDHRSSDQSGAKNKIYDYLKGDLLNKFNFSDSDWIVQLLPTSPLRQPEDIDAVVELATKNNCGAFSACEYDFHISFGFYPEPDGEWKTVFPESPMLTGNTQSQNQVKALHPNGSVNCLPVWLLKEGGPSIYHGCKYYEMDRAHSVDIDDLSDFELAEALLARRPGSPLA